MGHFTTAAVLLVCLGVGTVNGLLCNKGITATADDGTVLESSIIPISCDGVCTIRSTPLAAGQTLNVHSCDAEDQVSTATKVCREDMCNQATQKVLDGIATTTKGGYLITPASMMCYYGLLVENVFGNGTTFNVGASATCYGSCGRAHWKSSVLNITVELFGCHSDDDITKWGCTDYSLAGAVNITVCHCDDADNCNMKDSDLPTISPTVVPARQTIACYEGVVINNSTAVLGRPRYLACTGDCVSMGFTMSGSMGHQVEATMYTCDPGTICHRLGVVNSCHQIADGLVHGCCCDSDLCLDPVRGRYPPINELQCFVGYTIGKTHDAAVHGASMPCSGQCASVETTVNGVITTGYFCAPHDLCETVGRNDCASLNGDAGTVTGCCCDTNDNCNAADVKNIKPFTPSQRTPLACYSGLSLNGSMTRDPDNYMTCRGDCAQLTLTTTFGKNPYSVTMFTCDPVETCASLNLTNSCGSTANGMISGCCCDFNDCLDLNTHTVKPLLDNVQCFVGMSIEKGTTSTTHGVMMPCNGQCASFETDVNDYHTFGFWCASDKLCSSLNMTNTCSTIMPVDNKNYIKGCCCNDKDNCNFINANVAPPLVTASPARRDSPIACYSGLSFMGKLLSGPDSYTSCFGDCAQLTFATTLGGKNVNATLYSCDPIALCGQFGLVNNCVQVNNDTTTVQGCCCGWDDCLDLTSPRVKPDTSAKVQCFVGMSLEKDQTSTTHGQMMPCDGQCATFDTNVNGYRTYGFWCAKNSLCNSLNMNNKCATLQRDDKNYIEGCCCNDKDNCNFINANVAPPLATPAPIRRDSPITCYSGLSFMGKLISGPDSYTSCFGDCAQLTFQTMMGGKNLSGTIYTCDPIALCGQFGLSNNCLQVNNDTTTVQGCCCGWNDCLDLTSPRVKPDTSAKVQCFVGMSLEKDQTSTTHGQMMPCDGQCATFDTNVNGYRTYGFWCAKNDLCNALGMTNKCSTLQSDDKNFIEGCCCSDKDNCNFINANVAPPVTTPAPIRRDSPITCYSGLGFQGKLVSGPNSYTSCFGDCAQLTFQTMMGGKNLSATIYTCDPIALCGQFGLANNCLQVNNDTTTVQGCCCGWDDCLDLTSPKVKPDPTVVNVDCFVGMSTAGPNNTGSIHGQSVKCDGQCGTVATKVNDYMTYGFFCASNKLCNAYGMTDRCDVIKNDNGNYIQVCCCKDGTDCNTRNAGVMEPTGKPPTAPSRSPIACYSGVKVNDQLLTSADSYTSCAGDCAQVTYTSKFSGKSVAATIFSCDPVALCSEIGVNNKCAAVQHGNSSTTIFGCCCGFDDCIDLNTLAIKPTPTAPSGDQTTKSAAQFSLVISFITLLSVFLL